MLSNPFHPRLMHALAASLLCALVQPALASSHREAPFLTQNPKVDATDFYMFRSYEAGRGDFVTLIANYQPLQDGWGGPNFYLMDPHAVYEIHIDNNGDAREDLSFQFRFSNQLQDIKLDIGGKQVAIPLANAGPVSSPRAATLNTHERYTVALVRGDRRSGARSMLSHATTMATQFDKPADYFGNKSLPSYAAYAAQHVFPVRMDGCASNGRVFVGQRKDPFVVNLGGTFDLVNIAAPATAFDPQAENRNLDNLQQKNVTTLALELPIACLTAGAEPVIGAWTTASVRQARLINPGPASDIGSAAKEGGAWAQVSRLGMPLVNEVVIGLKDKNRFNTSKPTGDGQFIDYVTHPTLPALLEVLFGSAGVKAPTHFPRNDLVTTFLTGIPGINQPANVTASEMLRLNTSTPPVARGAQNRLGVIGGDAAGFPNGRRPGDDVVDVALRVVMGRLCSLNIGCAPADAPSRDTDFTDGAYLDDSMTDATFPYLKTPVPGANVPQ